MSYCNLPQNNIYTDPAEKYIKDRLDQLADQTVKFLQDLNKSVEESKRNLDNAINSSKKPIPTPVPRDLEKERITKLQGAKNKAIIFAAALITCIVINIIFFVLAPLATALSSLVVFAGIDYFLGSSLVREIKDYNTLKKI